MKDPLRPPEQITTREIANLARRVERLKLRRRALLKKLHAVEDDIRESGRLLRDTVRDATAPAAGDQLTIANGDLTEPRPVETERLE